MTAWLGRLLAGEFVVALMTSARGSSNQKARKELIRLRDGSSELNYAIYHDRYQRTGDGWKFTERVYEIRYLDTSPLAGSTPHAAEDAR